MRSYTIFTGLLAALLGAQPAAHAQTTLGTAPVKLEDRGAFVILDNGLVTATVSKAGGSIASLKFRGTEMVRPGGGNVYFSMDGGANYRTPSGCVFTVKTQTPDRYAKQLIAHLGRKIQFNTDGDTSTASFGTSTGQVVVGEG